MKLRSAHEIQQNLRYVRERYRALVPRTTRRLFRYFCSVCHCSMPAAMGVKGNKLVTTGEGR
jgi:hypothetical protein